MVCEWCQTEPATTEVVTAPSKRGKDPVTKKMVLKKAAKRLHVCGACKQTVERAMARSAKS